MVCHACHDHGTGNEKRTLCVIVITVIAMVAEISYGYMTNSMALLADGYHMGVHALSFAITYAAYFVSRKLSIRWIAAGVSNKIFSLAAYTSSIFLGITGVLIIVEGIGKFFNHGKIMFKEAIVVATIGLFVNVISIFIMGGNHCDPSMVHCGGNQHEDYNFKAAYFHILADILTSVFAVVSLLFCKYFNTTILDPIVSLFGGVLILKWAYNLLKKTSLVLVDIKRN